LLIFSYSSGAKDGLSVFKVKYSLGFGRGAFLDFGAWVVVYWLSPFSSITSSFL